MKKLEVKDEAESLYKTIAEVIQQARMRVAVSVNAELAMLNWQVGVYINDFVLIGNRAPYGKQIIANLSHKLTEHFNSGWSVKQLMHCLRSAEKFELDTFEDDFLRK